MVGDQLKTSTAASALGDVLGDLTDLVQKEMRLAKAEFSANLSAKLEGGVWLRAPWRESHFSSSCKRPFLSSLATACRCTGLALSRQAACRLSPCWLTLLDAKMPT